MYLPDIQLHEADTLEAAAALMEQLGPRAEYVAGGTDLLVDLKTARTEADHLISITNIDQARQLTADSEGLTIGSLVPVGRLNETPLSGTWAAIHDATQVMAAPAIRNMATVGGNLASAVPCADLPPILMVLGGGVDLWSRTGVRRIPVCEFFTGPRTTVRRHDEILLSIHVPPPANRSGASYERFALREGNSIAVASVAARIRLDDAGMMQEAALAIGAVAPTPLLLENIPAILAGRAPNETAWADAADAAVAAADPISDIRGSAEFRRELTGVLTARALRLATERIGGDST
ncbi:MAG: FAD binding domain-containing protein [Phycisphaerales bacterium]|nr:FAD binding domain-containing protein [Phycisphaerales bacterium]MDP6889864.1 FAD binding domain-containing protein [Phycisphaerales bacterium]